MAKKSRGKVENIGKTIDHKKEGTEKVQEIAEAKTIIDEQVQEILLKAAASVLDTNAVSIDGEEDTPSLSLFPTENADTTLVLDPIDGTLEYIKGTGHYSVVVALVQNGILLTSLVYFPETDILYFLKKGIAMQVDNFRIHGLAHAKEIVLKKQKTKKVFISYKVSETIEKKLAKNFQVVRDIDHKLSWTQSFLAFPSGEYGAVIIDGPQMRDVFLGAIIASAKGGYVLDWTGKQAKWPARGRIKNVLFSNGKIDEKILQCLH